MRDYSKEYGVHDYGDNSSIERNCRHACGCWMGPARSGGPVGVDPSGECPGNPKDGTKLGGRADYEVVVTRRIRGLESKLSEANKELAELRKIRDAAKEEMAVRIKILEAEVEMKNCLLAKVKEFIDKIIQTVTLV